MGLFTPRRKLHGVLLENGQDSPERCTSCDASCCRGFPSVELTAEEFGRLEQLGAQRLHFTLAGRFFLLIELGCDFLDGNRCRIYDARPDICRRFTCRELP